MQFSTTRGRTKIFHEQNSITCFALYVKPGGFTFGKYISEYSLRFYPSCCGYKR